MSARIDPGRALGAEVRRLLADEIGEAMAALATARTDPDRGIHAARKRFKTIRALLRLVRGADEEFRAREDARYRDLSRALSAAREATALVETVDRFLRDYPAETANLAPLRARLEQRCPSAGEPQLAWIIDKAIATCEAGDAAAARFEAPADAAAAARILELGVRGVLRRAVRALKDAEGAGSPEDFHALRKAVKAHAAHLSLLADFRQRGGSRRRAAADRLGTALGDLNDLAVMAGLIETAKEPLGSEREVATLQKLIRRKRKTLVRKTLAAARTLLDARPKDVAAKLAKAYRAAADKPAKTDPSSGG